MPYDPIDPTASIQASVRRMNNFAPDPYRSMLHQTTSLQSQASLILDFQRSLAPATSLQEVMVELFASNLDRVDSILHSGRLDSLDLALSSGQAVRQVLDSLQAPKFTSVRSLMVADFAHGAIAIHTMEEILGRVETRPLFEQQAQLLSESYTSFASGLASSALPAPLVSAALSAATANVERSSRILASLAGFDLSKEPLPFSPFRPNWFDVFREDIDVRVDDTEDFTAETAAQAVAETQAARLAAVAIEVITLYYTINVDSETTSGMPIFKATSKTTYVAGMLGNFSVGSRDDFDRFAEWLYCFVYEASGSWKRVLAFEPNYPKVADRIKHFRLYAAHDTQHGSRTEIESKGRQVGEHFMALIGRAVPRTPNEWREAQLALLSDVAAFLRQLHKRVVNTPPSA